MTIVKSVTMLLLTTTIILFTFQNSEPIEFNLLHLSRSLPLASVVLIGTCAGFLLGFLIGLLKGRRMVLERAGGQSEERPESDRSALSI